MNDEALLTSEWLVTNGLGGYASGTVSGVITRRYHGLLVAALPEPLGRVSMLSYLWERLRLPDRSVVVLSGEEHEGGVLELSGARHLRDFRLELGLPVWQYAVGGVEIEKRVSMPNRQNTVHLTYRLASGSGPVRLVLRPSIHFRPHSAPVNQPVGGPYALTAVNGRYELRSEGGMAPLRLYLMGDGAAFTLDDRFVRNVLYRVEERRGYEATGELWSPGYFRVDLTAGASVTMVGSTEPWEVVTALTPAMALESEAERRQRLLRGARIPDRPSTAPGSATFVTADEQFARQLVLASDQFVISPVGRQEDRARARAMGDDIRSVIAGYHWFTDWGRDTMISLEGLTLHTGRHVEAGYILRTSAHYIRDGLIPNLFPEGDSAGLYHTADATLWFFHAIDRYVEITGDRSTLGMLLPKLVDIVEHHMRGTGFGIGVDRDDGLLRQGAEGYQLTWMDAKVGDWVVTPRRGKAVEINALWYNALRLLEGWLREFHGDASAAGMADAAERARHAFNARFWNKDTGFLYDVVDGEGGDDPACRPNQIFAMSLRHPVLDPDRWEQVLEVVRERLLTPVGLRSLSPDHPDYKPYYDGDLRARDAAYHQGTVWAWLIGPFVDAWLRVHPTERAKARGFLEGFAAELHAACIGSISEVFDAEPPYTPRGCVAQAWSVAEVFRAWVKTAPAE